MIEMFVTSLPVPQVVGTMIKPASRLISEGAAYSSSVVLPPEAATIFAMSTIVPPPTAMRRSKPSAITASIILSVITSVGSPPPKSSTKRLLSGSPSGAKYFSYMGRMVSMKSPRPRENSPANSLQFSNLCSSVFKTISFINAPPRTSFYIFFYYTQFSPGGYRRSSQNYLLAPLKCYLIFAKYLPQQPQHILAINRENN